MVYNDIVLSSLLPMIFTRTALILSLSLLFLNAEARIGNSVSQNRSEYGKESEVENFGDNEVDSSFTGYRKYSLKDWDLTSFFNNGKVRSEHLTPKKDATLSRSAVRDWSGKMFPQSLRGAYKRQLKRYRAEGHFFDKGLVAYEYNIVGTAVKDFRGIKVLLYENNKNYWQINPKSYI